MSDFDSTFSITSESSREFISRHKQAFFDYLRKHHKRVDYKKVIPLLYDVYPDEGRKLIENSMINDKEKLDKLLRWIIHSRQITCLILGDQGMGKDALVCRLFELIIDYCKKNDYLPPRFVTLGNVKRPPFVNPRDMYFNLKDIPFGTKEQPVYIYSSELEAEFPARDFQGQENKTFALLQNTFRHNHQKIFGCVKLTANVDISVLRTCNVKLFKYISPEKLSVEGVERANLLSDLGRWFLPNDITDPAKTLMVFDNNLLTGKFRLPTFWSDEYSEQFKSGTIPKVKIYDFVKSKFDNEAKLTPKQINDLQTIVFQKFRYKITRDEIQNLFNT
jgi:hypothetical protein